MKKLSILIAIMAVLAFTFAMAGSPVVDGGIRQGFVVTYVDSIPDTVGTDTINTASGTDGHYYQTFTDIITITDWGGDSTAVRCYLQVSNDQSHWITLDSADVPANAIEADSAIVAKDWSTYAKLYKYWRIYNQQRDLGTIFGDSCIVRHNIFYAE